MYGKIKLSKEVKNYFCIRLTLENAESWVRQMTAVSQHLLMCNPRLARFGTVYSPGNMMSY
jgi:hypothetical protein